MFALESRVDVCGITSASPPTFQDRTTTFIATVRPKCTPPIRVKTRRRDERCPLKMAHPERSATPSPPHGCNTEDQQDDEESSGLTKTVERPWGRWVTTDVIPTSPQGHPTSLRVRGGEVRVEARVSSALTIWRVKIGGQEASWTQRRHQETSRAISGPRAMATVASDMTGDGAELAVQRATRASWRRGTSARMAQAHDKQRI
jgi:hypothetical protein